jgi:hypothetical protein
MILVILFQLPRTQCKVITGTVSEFFYMCTYVHVSMSDGSLSR